MKTNHVLSLAALAVSATLSHSVLAQQTVNFVGRVIDEACVASVGSGNTVTLPSIGKASLPTANAAGTHGKTTFTVSLANCDPTATNYQVNFSHSGASGVNGRLPNGTGSGYAEGVSLQLLSASGNVLKATDSASNVRNGDLAVDPGIDVSGTPGSGTGEYAVEYFRETGTFNPGIVNTNAVMTLNWQ